MKEAKEPPEPIGLAWIPILILPDGTVEEPPEDEPIYYRCLILPDGTVEEPPEDEPIYYRRECRG